MKKAIIIVIIILVFAAICIGLLFFFKSQSQLQSQSQPSGTSPSTQSPPAGQGQSTSTQNNPGTDLSEATLAFGDASISGSDISSALPADAPTGPTILFQAASGTIPLKNFYASAQGYEFNLDLILLQYNASYTLWYSRGDSSFAIDLPEDGSDQAAAEAALANDLGVSTQTLCSLPVTADYTFDRGNSNQELPLEACPQQSL